MSVRKKEIDEHSLQESWTPFAKVYDPLTVGHINGANEGKLHDRGLIRALQASYKPDKKLRSDPERTIFVGRLNPATTEETLQAFFLQFGSIKSLRLVRDFVTGFSKRYAFVEYISRRDMENAFRDANRQEIDGYAILVDKEHGRLMPGWVPRRLGGGFGGKKESGQLRFGCRDKPWKRTVRIRLGGEHNIKSGIVQRNFHGTK